MLLHTLKKHGLIDCPAWLPDNTVYLTIVGSQAYGVATPESDYDLVGICIPKKEIIFPHLSGRIDGFGRQHQKFEQYRAENVLYKDKRYDITVYNIVKYLNSAMEGNPNMVEVLFTEQDCILHCTQGVGTLLRENRKLLFSKALWPKHKGYAYSQLHKMPNARIGKRKEGVEIHGFDLKFAYNSYRLLSQIEQILTKNDLDLRRDSEVLKSIRRGEWTQEQVKEHFNQKEKFLEELYEKSDLPWAPREQEVYDLLVTCLEKHYGSLDNVVSTNKYEITLNKIREIVDTL